MTTATITMRAKDEPGVALRVVSIATTNPFTLESVSISKSGTMPGWWRCTVSVDLGESSAELLLKRFNRLVFVEAVTIMDADLYVQRSYAVARIAVASPIRTELLEVLSAYRGEVLELKHNALVVEVRAEPGQIATFLGLLEKFAPAELAVAGPIAIRRAR